MLFDGLEDRRCCENLLKVDIRPIGEEKPRKSNINYLLVQIKRYPKLIDGRESFINESNIQRKKIHHEKSLTNQKIPLIMPNG
jgi:hypothetical protein